LLFGASFGGVIAVVVVYVREISPPEDVTYVIGATAIIGCIGQIAGPAVSGMVAEATGSLTGSFLISAMMCFLSIPLIGLASWSHGKSSGNSVGAGLGHSSGR
jgi:MFS family permease